MSYTLTPLALQSVQASETGEVWLPLVKLSHPSWPDDERIVPNWQAVTHLGEVYEPHALEIALPDEEPDGIPVIAFAADNVDRRLSTKLRAASGTVTASIVWVMASAPDVIERGPIEVELRGTEYSATEVTGSLSVEPILERSFGHMVMSPSKAPGLF